VFALLAGLVALVLAFLGRPSGPAHPDAAPAGAADSTAAPEVVYRNFTEPMMGTTLQAQLPESAGADSLARAVFDVFREVDARMSEWKPTSPLSAVNAAAGEPEGIPVPGDLRALVTRGKEIGDLTHGAFDITWAALWGVWDFKAESPHVPDPGLVAARAALVDYRRVEVDDAAGTVRLPRAGMKIGLGGIAKGYALDRAAAMLRGRGLRSFMLLAGGQVLVAGEKNGRPWRVGIRDPRSGPEDYFAQLTVQDVSVSTSGDYESFFIVDGVRYHHILDPSTGMPARGLRSATVVTPDGTLADALSTALMVLGPERGLALAESLPGVEAVLVDDQGQVRWTAGLAGRLVEVHPPTAGYGSD